MAEFNPELGTGKVMSGQQYDSRKNIDLPFTQEDVSFTGPDSLRVTGEEGTPGLDQTPKDANDATLRQFNLAAIVAAILAIPPFSWFSYSSIALPDVLTGVVVGYNSNSGDGETDFPDTQSNGTFTGGGSIVLSPHATAQSSGAILPTINPVIKQYFARNIPTFNFSFYIAGQATLEQILARTTQCMIAAGTITPATVTISKATPGVISWTANGLTNGQPFLLGVSTGGTLPAPLVTTRVYYAVSVATNTVEAALTQGGAAIATTTTGSGTFTAVASAQQMPVFKTAFYTITAQGQQGSIAASASTSAQINSNFDGSSYGASYAWGNGSSQEFGVTNATKEIGPVINGLINISSSSAQLILTATVSADTPDLILNGSTIIGQIINQPTPITATITALVTPNTLAATTPAAVPTSGYIMIDVNSSIDDYGLQLLHVAVVNFAVFA